jgi:hypothetical protein
MPDAHLVLSTREAPSFRDAMAGTGISKMSVASRTTVGGYCADVKSDSGGQFDVNDTRDVDQFCDMLRKKDLTGSAENLKSMIREASNRSISVVMMAVPNPTLILSPAEFYEIVADEMGILIDVDTISDVLQFPGNKSDAVHPNEKGYRAMAESLQALLESNGAI